MPLPPKGTPQREKRDKYQLEYRRNYISLHLMFDKRNPRDIAITKGLDGLPYKTKTEFVKRAIEEKLGIQKSVPERKSRADSFISKLDD